MNIVAFLIIGLVAGFVAGLIMKGRGFGFGGNLVVGVLGGLIGGLLFETLGLSPNTLIGSLIAAVVGACLLLAAIGVLKKA